MCGIFSLITPKNYVIPSDIISNSFNNFHGRGPDSHVISSLNDSITFGFHRLSINGLSNLSNQPLVIDNITLICNGEIYNHKQLMKSMNKKYITASDCEVIIYLYLNYGIEYAISALDGVFSFILYDGRLNEIFIGRDPLGVRPMFIYRNEISNVYGIASELKGLDFRNYLENGFVSQFKPGSYSKFTQIKGVYHEDIREKSYFLLNQSLVFDYFPFQLDHILTFIVKSLTQSVIKRIQNTERPIACLLSGGLDSSLITAIVNENLHLTKCDKLTTYSVGFEGSDDLICAKKVASYINTNHHEILINENSVLEYIDKVIYAIESYDVTTIRASLGNYILGEYISKNSDQKVIFNGDGADELFGGYLYFRNASDSLEFDKECKRLLSNIHYFDVLRSDRTISCHGLETRTPYLDKTFVQNYLSIPAELRYVVNNKYGEKYLIRKAFSEKYIGKALLPENILFRKKEAFSDGVSKQTTNLFDMIKQMIDLRHPGMSEATYYKQIFDKYYPNANEIIPYQWMPQYSNAVDPSARSLFNTKLEMKNLEIDMNQIFIE